MTNRVAKYLFSFILILSVLFAAAVMASANEYYVNVNKGNDSANGSKSAPFATIQKAADIVKPGDTVIIAPGIYYENIELKTNGTKEKPIIFKAEKFERDSVIITGAHRDVAEHKVEWTLEDEALGLYSMPLDYQIYRMTANDVQVVEYRSLTGLKTFIYNATDEGNPGYAYGYEHGFFSDTVNKKLYVRLGNDGCIPINDPNSKDLTIHFTRTPTSNKSNWISVNGTHITNGAQGQAAIMGKDSFLFGVTTETSANVVISGITFKMPAVTAVWARCHDLTVSNCWFIGCIEGVRGGCAATADSTFVSKNITIEHCFYTNYPIYSDSVKMIKKYKDNPAVRTIALNEEGDVVTDAKGKIPEVTVPKILWFWHAKNGMTCNYEGGGLACYIGENWTVRYNHFDELLDGFASFGNFSYWKEYTANGKTSMRQVPAKNLKIYGNKFDKICDNSIEMEDNVQGMEVAYNEFTNQFSPFSWQPLSGIPYGTNVNIHHNIVYNDPDETWEIAAARNHITYNGKTYQLSSPQYFGLFKLGANRDDFGKLSWMLEQSFPMDANGYPLDPVRPGDDGVRVWNNTFIFPNGAFEENVGALGGGVDNDSNFVFKNNIISVIVCAQDGTYKGGFKTGQAYTAGRGVKFENNMLVSALNIEGAKKIGDINVEFAAVTPYAEDPIAKAEAKGIYKDSIDKVGFVDWRNKNFELTAESSAIGSGVQLEHTEESTVDMGAIPYGEKWVMKAGPYLEADINADGKVDLADIAMVSYSSNSNEYDIRADLDNNGKVNGDDLNIMLEIYARNGGAIK